MKFEDFLKTAPSVKHHALLLTCKSYADKGLSAEHFRALAQALCDIKLSDPASFAATAAEPNKRAKAKREKAGAAPTESPTEEAFWKHAAHHPDIFIVDRERNSLRLEEVNPLQELALYPPQISRRRLLLVDRCERILPVAANSLLKTLEEPSSSVIFILTTSTLAQVLPTIISRCQKILLTNESQSPDALELIAAEDAEWLRAFFLKMYPLWSNADHMTCCIPPVKARTLQEIMERSGIMTKRYTARILQDALASLAAKTFEQNTDAAPAVRFLMHDLGRWRDMESYNPSRDLWLARILLRMTSSRKEESSC